MKETLEGSRELPWYFIHDYSIPLPKTLAATIGEIVVNWGAFENDIARDVSLMMRFPLVQRLAKEPMRAFGKRIDLWCFGVHTLFPAADFYRAHANALAKEAKRLSKIRNRLIHGQWRANIDDTDPKWIIFIENGYDKSNIDGFYIGEEQADLLNQEIRSVRIKFVEFTVNRLWHAQLGLLSESHEPTVDNPAHLILKIDEWPPGTAGQLDPKLPEGYAKTFLFRD